MCSTVGHASGRKIGKLSTVPEKFDTGVGMHL